jgi:AraC-like DNA-binding protein
MGWAFSSANLSVEKEFDAGGRIELDDQPFSGFMEHRAVQRGMSLFRARGQGANRYSLSALGEINDNKLVLGCMLSGAGQLVAQGNDEVGWRNAAHMYGVSLSGRPIRYDLQPHEEWSAMALMLTPELLDNLDGDLAADGLRAVERVLAGVSEPISLMRPMNSAMLRIAQELMEPRFAGSLGQLHREAKAGEMLVHLLAGLFQAGEGRHRDPDANERRRVREARERLLADLRDPPSLGRLAAEVGLTPRRLNRGFRALYGMTVFELLLEARLERARRMLDSGEAMPLKQLAYTVGYSQHTNFINAFRRRFGVSPGRYRGESR